MSSRHLWRFWVQSAGNRNHHSWPALFAALLLTVGIVPGYRYGLPFVSSELAAGGILLLSVAVCASTIRTPHGVSPLLSLIGAGIVVSTGAVMGAAARSAEPLLPVTITGEPVTVIGEVLEPPSWSGNSLRFRLAVHTILSDTIVTHVPVTALVAVRSGEGAESTIVPDYGMTVVLHGLLELPRSAPNPGEFDARAYYRANDIAILLRVRGNHHVCILDSGGGWWAMRTIVAPARRTLLDHIDRSIGGEEGEFLKGLMIGERGGLSPQLRAAFLTSGVAHILAVSGSNVAVVAAALFAILLLLRIPRRLHAYPVACAMLLYMLLTGSQPSVVRATIMALVGLLVSRRGIRGNGLNAIGIAALIMFFLDVRQVFDMGFQLSFGAVLSIILLYPKVNRRIIAWKGNTRFRRITRGGLRLAAVSLVASVGTFPLSAGAFGQVSVIGLLANIVVVPVSGWSVVLGLLSAAAEPLSATAAASLSALNASVLAFTLRVVSISAGIPWASFTTFWFEPVYTFPFLGVLGIAYHAGDPSTRRLWCIVALAGTNLAVYLPGRYQREPGTFFVTAIDVGQGDAILLEHPDGGAALIDTGPVPFDERRGLVPFLRRRGISALDVVVITHPHDDHNGGLSSLCKVIAVGRLITHSTARAGTLISWKDDCRLQILHAAPPDAGLPAPEQNPNRLSVVVRLVYGRTAFLFAADAEVPEEVRMIHGYGVGLESTALKVGHHGSASATTDAWLDAVQPVYAIITVGQRNRFGHPSAAVLRRLLKRGIHIARTDEDGAVMLGSDGTTVRRYLWR